MMKTKHFIITLFLVGSFLLLQGLYFYSKGAIAQYIISGSFDNSDTFGVSIKKKITQEIFGIKPIGRIKIPSINIDQTILEGSTQKILAYGPGKIINNYQLHNENSNIVISGHRDSFFRNLKHIKINDIIFIEHTKGKSKYEVVQIIKDLDPDLPENVKYLDENIPNILTLVTCYPFDFIGSAPKRYLVIAKLII